jgi:hypothetical protein
MIGPIDLTGEEFREYRIDGAIRRIDKPTTLHAIIGNGKVQITDATGTVHEVPPTMMIRCRFKDKSR